MNTRLARLRRPLAALLAAAAAGTALMALRPGPPPSVHVPGAARDLPAGTTLRPSDLRALALPPGAVPSGALRTSATGRVLAAPMRRGEPLTDARLIGDSLLEGYAPGTVAAPVRIADAASVRLLHPGNRIDILTTRTTPTPDPLTAPPPDTPPEEASPTTNQPRTTPSPHTTNQQNHTTPSARTACTKLSNPPTYLTTGHRPGSSSMGIAALSPPEARGFAIDHFDPADQTASSRPDDPGGWRGARLVVSEVPVLAVPPSDKEGGQDGALIVVATNRTQAAALAGAGGPLSITITGGH
ncbi:SAF domain-containing protein [Actinomadura litoris]|uniref:SAF domain-containing protein n=1 Tax=Actinomadura litoris TaxID=2678616 RepID=UPI001FA7CBEF|nr:SAF domain-containing protein [Actinomadura litoris]